MGFIVLGWVLLLLSGCARDTNAPPPSNDRFYALQARTVLEAAEEVLRNQGYVFEENELDLGILVGRQVERTTRGRDSVIKGTIINTQVAVEATESEGGTDLLASFNISTQRPTGERRTFSSETPQAQRLRRQFYSELELQLGLEYATSRP